MDLKVLYAMNYTFAFITGTCIFSFLNVVVFRIPRKQSFVKGFSYCPACNHRLGVLDLCPIFSYLFLGGKCRYCKAEIPARDTFVEFLGGLLAAGCMFRFGELYSAVCVFAFFCILMVVALLDLDTMEIEDGCHVMILLIAGVSCFVMPEISLISRLIGFLCISLPMLLVTLVIPGGFGGGDIKLMAVCGLVLGVKWILLAAFFGILTGGIYGMMLLATGKKERKAHFPFAPFLCLGMVISVFWGDIIWNWYLGFLNV
ncbi:MAG: prepilin peptidase [Blautia sp.]|nr:prepilin peptidase [Blautia sp.]